MSPPQKEASIVTETLQETPQETPHDPPTNISDDMLYCGCSCGACQKDENDNYCHQDDNSKHSEECTKCWDAIAEELSREYEEEWAKRMEEEEETERQMYLEGNYYKDLWC